MHHKIEFDKSFASRKKFKEVISYYHNTGNTVHWNFTHSA